MKKPLVRQRRHKTKRVPASCGSGRKEGLERERERVLLGEDIRDVDIKAWGLLLGSFM